MFRIASTALVFFRAFVAISVPCCYCLLGLYCLLSHFDWPATAVIGMFHLGIFLAAQQVAQEGYKPILFFICFVFLGVLIFVAAWVWISWMAVWILREHDRYAPFPLALVGSVAWSIASWECTAYLFLPRARKDGLETASPSITRADQFLVLATPMIIASILGVVHAVTDPEALVLSERVADFFAVVEIGIACGLFLALPWFCLPFALKFWEEKGHDHRVGPAILGDQHDERPNHP
jgi:hypothetical protein